MAKFKDNRTNAEEMHTITITNNVIKELEAIAKKLKSPMIQIQPGEIDGHNPDNEYRKDHEGTHQDTSSPTEVPKTQ